MNTLKRNSSPIRHLHHTLIAAVAVWGAVNVSADHTGQADHKEAAFIKDAAQGGQAEVEVGKLAAERGQNSQIKQLGERLQQDHTKANAELTQIAQNLGVSLPAEPARKENRMAQKLQDKTGVDFDKAFAEHALVDHEKDIRKFEKASQDTKNAELKAFIDKTIPVLRQHLEMARNAAAAVGVDQKYLSAADRFLSSPSTTGRSSGDLHDYKQNQGLGTAPSSQSGAGSNGSSTSPDQDHLDQTKPHDTK